MDLLQAVVDALQEAGFEAYFNQGLRKYFDIIAVREYKLFIKVLANIDNLGPVEGAELRRFSDAFSSSSLVVGERAGMGALEDDVIYQRHGNPCVALSTLGKLLKGESVSTFTRRGQLLVSIDGAGLKQLREERGISQDDLAKALECTGQTVYRIENQNRIQEDLFDKLVDFLGRDIRVGSIELSQPSGKVEVPVSDPLKKEIVREYLRLKLENIPLETPVDFALVGKAVREQPVLTPVSRTEAELRSKQRVVKNLSDVLECGVVHITREKKVRRLPSISFEELHCISTKREILERSD